MMICKALLLWQSVVNAVFRLYLAMLHTDSWCCEQLLLRSCKNHTNITVAKCVSQSKFQLDLAFLLWHPVSGSIIRSFSVLTQVLVGSPKRWKKLSRGCHAPRVRVDHQIRDMKYRHAPRKKLSRPRRRSNVNPYKVIFSGITMQEPWKLQDFVFGTIKAMLRDRMRGLDLARRRQIWNSASQICKA